MKDEFLCNNKWSRGVGGIKRIYCRITIIQGIVNQFNRCSGRRLR